MAELTTFSVSLALKDSDGVDDFYKYRGEHLPEVGQVINVVRFLRGRTTRARVTRVDADYYNPQITATQID